MNFLEDIPFCFGIFFIDIIIIHFWLNEGTISMSQVTKITNWSTNTNITVFFSFIFNCLLLGKFLIDEARRVTDSFNFVFLFSRY